MTYQEKYEAALRQVDVKSMEAEMRVREARLHLKHGENVAVSRGEALYWESELALLEVARAQLVYVHGLMRSGGAVEPMGEGER